MNLDPTPSTDELIRLEAARLDFPRYQIDVERALDRLRYVARRIQPGPGPHTLVTSDLTELCAELGSRPQRALPEGHARSME